MISPAMPPLVMNFSGLYLTLRPQRLVKPDAWVEHIPFLMWLIERLRPRTLVELGTHSGNSFCAACQAVSSFHLSTACYAVDTWRGDEHAGYYDEAVFEELKLYHDAKYSAFSGLIRSAFDEALAHFEDGTIDLLHIDGRHTYDAVRGDFESWLPKLAGNGVILFHDTNAHERSMQVWKFWKELQAQYPSFEFLHGHGLGVLFPKGIPESIADFMVNEEAAHVPIRHYFASLGRANTTELARMDLWKKAEDLMLSKQVLEDRGKALERTVQSLDARNRLLEKGTPEVMVKAQVLEVDNSDVEEHVFTLEKQVGELEKQIRGLKNQYKEALFHAADLEQGIGRTASILSRREKSMQEIKKRLLKDVALISIFQSTANTVNRLYTQNKRIPFAKVLLLTPQWKAVDDYMAQAEEASQKGQLRLACERYHAAATTGVGILKKLRRNFLVRPLLRGHVLNSIQEQLSAEMDLLKSVERTRKILPPRRRIPSAEGEPIAGLDLIYYSEQAKCKFVNVEDAARHYAEYGWRSGLNPHSIFDTAYFIKANEGRIEKNNDPLAEYQHLLDLGEAPEAHPQYPGEWLRKWFTQTSLHDLRQGGESMPGLPFDIKRATEFSRQSPRLAIGIILFETGAAELKKILNVIDRACVIAVREGFALPHICLTDNSHRWTVASIFELTESLTSTVQFFPTNVNGGFGAGHNHLMRKAFTDLDVTHYLCLNPDGLLHPYCVSELLAAALREKVPALIEAIQVPCEHPKEYDAETLETSWSTAGCLLIPRFLFEITGGFDEQFFMYCEDVDFSWRVWEKGYRCLVAPRALFHHRVAARDFNPVVDQWYWESGRILGSKWRCPRFQLLCEQYLISRNYHASIRELPPLQETSEHRPHLRVDFGNMFTFARPRW